MKKLKQKNKYLNKKILPRTEDLINQLILIFQKQDFVLDKIKAQKYLLKTYDLFNLTRPKKIIWYKDIFDKQYQKILDTSPAILPTRADSAASNYMINFAASPAVSSHFDRVARLVWLDKTISFNDDYDGIDNSIPIGWSSLIKDFDWYVLAFEYFQNPHKNCPINDNGLKCLEYFKFLQKAKEHGAGYWIENEDILYCVPSNDGAIEKRRKLNTYE